MTTTAYKPGARPTEILANLIGSYWDTRSGSIPKPTIIEKPYADAQRIDLRNTGDYCVISLGVTASVTKVSGSTAVELIDINAKLRPIESISLTNVHTSAVAVDL